MQYRMNTDLLLCHVTFCSNLIEQMQWLSKHRTCATTELYKARSTFRYTMTLRSSSAQSAHPKHGGRPPFQSGKCVTDHGLERAHILLSQACH